MSGLRWIAAVGLTLAVIGAAVLGPARAAGVIYAPVQYEPAPLAPLVGIKAERGRRVRRGAAALIVTWLSPCRGRDGQLVRLLRNGRPNGSRYVGRACTARFHPRVRRGTVFTAELVPQEETDPFAASRPLKIKINHRRRPR